MTVLRVRQGFVGWVELLRNPSKIAETDSAPAETPMLGYARISRPMLLDPQRPR